MNLLDAVVAQGLIYVVQCEGFVPECFLASLPGDYSPPHDGPPELQEDLEELFLCFLVALPGQLSSTLSALEAM